MRTVVVESPLSAPTTELLWRNVRYARAACRDCLINHNEAPFASHLLYAQPGLLDDNVPSERELGIAAGLEYVSHADYTVVYVDFGVSDGMKLGIAEAERLGRTIYYRTLEGWG